MRVDLPNASSVQLVLPWNHMQMRTVIQNRRRVIVQLWRGVPMTMHDRLSNVPEANRKRHVESNIVNTKSIESVSPVSESVNGAVATV